MNKKNMVIGNVVSELGFKSFCFGERAWRWKKRYFSRFSINPYEGINPHTVIVGESGVGKSNATKSIVISLHESGTKIAILDPHNEYIGISKRISAEIYDASTNGINIFDLDGISERERASEITGMLKRNFRLGEVQGYTLYRCIMYTYNVMSARGRTPNIHDLIYSVKIFKRNSNTTSEKNVLEGIERRLSLLDTGAFHRSVGMNEVVSMNSIFLLSGLHTPEAQSIYIEGFLRKVYSYMLSCRHKDSGMLYIVIDEAEKLGDNPIIGKLAAEGRKYGVGIIAVSQRAKPIDNDLRGNAAMFISFNVREPEELNYISNFIAGGNEMGRYIEVKKAVRNLRRGYGIVSKAQGRNPFIVRFEGVRSEDNISFSILQAARDGINVTGLREVLKMHGDADIEAELESLTKCGKIRSCVMDCGRYSGVWYISESHNSAEHDVAVKMISAHLLSIGVKNRVYNNSYGPDIVAFCNGKSIAIEYETGSKDLESTVKMVESRKGKYSKTVVVVNDKKYKEYSDRFDDAVRLSRLDSDDFASKFR
ncbi:MAG: DUF87 domain-containing protein [Candidatus Marsarchaeota archaeon]|nr:DUF87 domain-containing protein [Candidatus Marsarchaeota archaeon]MCL5413316.1 DUF87 domain-containing protein [Candidatus Marsarchaeota archaeon]